MLPLCIGIAILRYRLYDIDLLINRTLVYGALSAGVVGLYVLLVGALGALFQSSGNLLISLLATGLAACSFQPLRARLQRGVNRLMYGERDDPYAVLSRLGQRLKTTLAPTAVLPSIAEAVAQTLKLPYVAILRSTHGDRRLEIARAIVIGIGRSRGKARRLRAAAGLPGRDGRPVARRAARAGRSVHARPSGGCSKTWPCKPASPPTPCA